MSTILVKANKGGVGKSWITLQLGHGLALEGHKVLIITSDSQNNVPEFAGIDGPFATITDWISNKGSDLTKLRDNLFYIALDAPYLSEFQEVKFETIVNVLKSEFDYILVDSTPVLNLDNKFIEMSDKVVIPTFLDAVTMNSITTLMDNIFPASKVKAIIPNRAGRTKLEKEYYSFLKEIIPNKIYLSVPLNQSAFISRLIDDGKTVWESKNKYSLSLQNLFKGILGVLLDERDS